MTSVALFLDEIGDMSPALQVKLLRVLQDGTYDAVGERLELRHLPPRSLPRRDPGTASAAIRDATRAAESELIADALARHGFDRRRTARALGIHKSTLHGKIHALGSHSPSATAAPEAGADLPEGPARARPIAAER